MAVMREKLMAHRLQQHAANAKAKVVAAAAAAAAAGSAVSAV